MRSAAGVAPMELLPSDCLYDRAYTVGLVENFIPCPVQLSQIISIVCTDISTF